MLQFDHPNLVNLVGVAVQQRPWLAVLEFMRFGDLHAVVKKCQQFNVILHSLEHLCILSQVPATFTQHFDSPRNHIPIFFYPCPDVTVTRVSRLLEAWST